MKKILIVEDEESIRMTLEDDLRYEGYEVETAGNGLEGFRKGSHLDIDLIILDVMLPEMNGFDVCSKLRMKGIKTPIIMLTAKGQEIDRVLGLELGADDYVTKPFSPRELLARIKAMFRRTEKEPEVQEHKTFERFNIKVDFQQYECFKNGKLVPLTKYEFEILKYLIENKERVVNRNEILDTHLANLRKKIEDDPADPKLILSVRGVGYKISKDDDLTQS